MLSIQGTRSRYTMESLIGLPGRLGSAFTAMTAGTGYSIKVRIGGCQIDRSENTSWVRIVSANSFKAFF
jgi:hypothetical protein